jgi:hypothetical protein
MGARVLARVGAVCVAAAIPGSAAADPAAAHVGFLTTSQSGSSGSDSFTCPTPDGSAHPPQSWTTSHPRLQATFPASAPIVIPAIPIGQAKPPPNTATSKTSTDRPSNTSSSNPLLPNPVQSNPLPPNRLSIRTPPQSLLMLRHLRRHLPLTLVILLVGIVPALLTVLRGRSMGR